MLALACFSLISCGKNFPDIVAQAEKSFSEKNYIDAVDAINNGLTSWKESDGNDVKGRAYEVLGKSYHQLRNTDKASEAYTKAAALSRQTFDSSYALGNLHLAQNHPAMARKYFQEALSKRPDDPLALLGLGNSYYLEGKGDEAIASFEKVLSVSPGVREAIEQIAVLKSRSGKKLLQRKRRR